MTEPPPVVGKVCVCAFLLHLVETGMGVCACYGKMVRPTTTTFPIPACLSRHVSFCGEKNHNHLTKGVGKGQEGGSEGVW